MTRVNLLPNWRQIHIETAPNKHPAFHRRSIMLRWALLFLVVALIAALFGFTDVAGTSMVAAKILFFVFLVLFVISLLMGTRSPRETV
jgi:uncharacterized membrane protein YtjA (UPF0391 family)